MSSLLEESLSRLGLSTHGPSEPVWHKDPFFVSMTDPAAISSTMGPPGGKGGGSDPHPSFSRLAILVLSAVLEVVCVSLPGYLIARRGLFDSESQKFMAKLNILLFTPCLIFSKIASQLTPDKLPELVIIPVIFLLQTVVSWAVATIVSKMMGLKKRPRYFVTAMSVFGNSNSLPISLTISLSKTIPSLRWGKIPGDNSEEVAARGILYLMIFQQLGQLVRWSWGYHHLLRKAEKFAPEDGGCEYSRIESGTETVCDTPTENDCLLSHREEEEEPAEDPDLTLHPSSASSASSSCSPEFLTITLNLHQSHSSATLDEVHHHLTRKPSERAAYISHGDNNVVIQAPNHGQARWYSPLAWARALGRALLNLVRRFHAAVTCPVFAALPPRVQLLLKKSARLYSRFMSGFYEFMNNPLWAMIAALIVACSPQIRYHLFTKGTFVNTSVTRAVEQTGQVAVPLILVVLGANLANNTAPSEHDKDTDEPKLQRKLIIISLVCRMLLPTLIMAPILALSSKYVPISILGDPVFVVVAFLLSGAPSALQLAQICQINNVYMSAMTNILFQAYVVWILPSTLLLVMLAIEVVKWSARF